MKKNQRVGSNEDIVSDRMQHGWHYVPRGHIGTLVLNDYHTGETGRPVIEIFLICETPRILAVKAPFDTPFPPPSQARKTFLIPAETQPANIIQSVFLSVLKSRRESMADYPNRPVAEFVEKRLGISKKEEIGVQISD
jgi:hypothetical protein